MMAAMMTAHLRAMLYALGFTQNGPVMDSIVTSMLLAGLPRNTATHPGLKASPVEGTPDDDASVLRKVTAFTETMYGKTGPIVRKACNRALEDASRIEGFTRNHPRFCVVVALGTIVLLTPSFITLLGFAAEGPTAGRCFLSIRLCEAQPLTVMT